VSEVNSLKDTARRRRTRERLMDAAYDLFANHGVTATSIEAIAEEAGFTRGAFYSNFESKTELFFAMANREWDVRLEKLQEAMGEKASPGGGRAALNKDFISEVVRDVFSLLPDDRKWGLIYREFELLALRDPEVAPQFLENYNDFRHALAQVLVNAAQTMGIRFTLEPEEVTRLVMLQYEAAMREAMLSNAPDESAATHKIMLRIIPGLLQQLTEEID